MKITLVLKESIYDCKIKITDSKGSRYYYITALLDDETITPFVTADVFDNDFDLTLIPIMPDTKSMLNDFEDNNWKDKFAKKAAKVLFSSLEKAILRVGCTYRAKGIQDGDRLDINLQSYTFGTFDRYGLLELIPMMYIFFEASVFNKRFCLINTYETNRKDVLKFAKTLMLTGILGNGLFVTMLTYPIQVGRVKRLTKNKRISKVLRKFNSLSDEDRQKFLDKQEKFFDS